MSEITEQDIDYTRALVEAASPWLSRLLEAKEQNAATAA